MFVHFSFAFHRWLMSHVVEHRSFHADYAIRECAVVAIYVPVAKRCEDDEQSYENSHLTSLSRFI